MMKTRNKLKITSLLLAIVMVLSMLPVLSLTAFAAATELTVTIDTGAEITLQDADGDGFYDIGTADELYAFAAAVNGGNGTINGELTADIVVNENVLDENGELNGDGLNFRVWTPIGINNCEFRGIFDGGEHTVSGLYVNDASADYVGLFGWIYNSGTVKNVGVVNSYLSGCDFVGSIGGRNYLGTITNCYNNGPIIGFGTRIGGIVGKSDGTIDDCYNNGMVNGEESVGGIAGQNAGKITNCYNTGTVNGTGLGLVGGVVGESSGEIAVCYNVGKVTGKFKVGGVVGNNESTITDCYNTGDIIAENYVGGIAAINKGTIFDCWNTGSLTCEECVNYRHNIVDNVCGQCNQPNFTIVGQQLNIGGDLSMKYYVRTLEAIDDSMLTMQFIFNGVVTEVKATPVANEENTWYFTLNGINPQCMGDNIYATLFYNGTEVANHGYEDNYSVEENLNNLLKQYKDDTALVTLVNDLLAYGTASEVYTGHTSMKGEGDYTVGEVTSVEYPSTKHTDKSENVELESINVRFGTMNYLVFRFTGEGLSADSIFKIDGEAPAEMYMESENVLVVVSKPISPENFDESVSLKYYEGDNLLIEIDYSINAYCNAIIFGSDFTEEMTSLAKALYNYGESAELYNHVKTGVGEHTGGIATCVSGKICDICKTVYSEVDSTNHASDKDIYTDNGDGTHDKVCSVCGYVEVDNEKHTAVADSDNCICGATVIAVIDGTLGGKTEATDEEVNALVDQLKAYVDNGITTIIVTGSNPAMITVNNVSMTAIGEAIYRLSGSGTHSADNQYNGKIDLILPDVPEIVGYEFRNAYALNSVTLPKVTTVGEHAFDNCLYLQKLTFGSVVTLIKDNLAFHYVGKYADGGYCDLVLNREQVNAETEYQPNPLTNQWWNYTLWKSITLI